MYGTVLLHKESTNYDERKERMEKKLKGTPFPLERAVLRILLKQGTRVDYSHLHVLVSSPHKG